MQSGDAAGDTPGEGERGVEGIEEGQGQVEREEKPKKKEKKVLL